MGAPFTMHSALHYGVKETPDEILREIDRVSSRALSLNPHGHAIEGRIATHRISTATKAHYATHACIKDDDRHRPRPPPPTLAHHCSDLR